MPCRTRKEEAMKIVGHVDRIDEHQIDGWIADLDAPNHKIALEVLLDDKVVAWCMADQFREDLDSAGQGIGHSAFSCATPAFIPKSDVSRLALRLEGSVVFLRTGGSDPAAVAAPARDTISRFGGLWIDRSDWIDRLGLMQRSGELSDELASSIFRFVRDGYLVIPGAVPHAVVDAVNSEIDRAWASPPPGLLVETFEPDGDMKVVTPEVGLRPGRTKMLDLFAHSAVVSKAVASPKVVAFLRAIFDDMPKAFQGLTFWNGSQQAIHKDTAYVKIDSNPMHLAATWLALEDIAPGTGELEYFIGSHRAPDYLFGGTSKWAESNPSEHDDFLSSLHRDAKALGHVKGAFRARKGDVLVWHADLAHGGSAITAPGRTRRSLVTHFTAASDEPFYRRNAVHKELDVGGCRFVSQYADVSATPLPRM
jgi:phytanoyl-CoA hydroxylase